jgi:hypothetical protein
VRMEVPIPRLLRERRAEHTGHVSEGVSNQDPIGVLRMVPLQVDCLQVGLPDSETPGGTGYLGKEERVGEMRGEGTGRMRGTQKTKHRHEGIDLGQPPCWTAAEPHPSRAYCLSRM